MKRKDIHLQKGWEKKQIRINKIDRKTQSKRRDQKDTLYPLNPGSAGKNQNKSKGRLYDAKKKIEQGSIVNEPKINKVKGNVPLINST